jgi:hypothetical protein
LAEESHKRHPVGRFDAQAKSAFTAAQRDAESRGGKVLVSGLLLYAAARTGGTLSSPLLEAMSTDIDTLNAAVDAEWNARLPWMQDQPFTVMKEAFEAVARDSPPDAELHLDALLAITLKFPDSMASRVVRRVGSEPSCVAERLMAQ